MFVFLCITNLYCLGINPVILDFKPINITYLLTYLQFLPKPTQIAHTSFLIYCKFVVVLIMSELFANGRSMIDI